MIEVTITYVRLLTVSLWLSKVGGWLTREVLYKRFGLVKVNSDNFSLTVGSPTVSALLFVYITMITSSVLILILIVVRVSLTSDLPPVSHGDLKKFRSRFVAFWQWRNVSTFQLNWYTNGTIRNVSESYSRNCISTAIHHLLNLNWLNCALSFQNWSFCVVGWLVLSLAFLIPEFSLTLYVCLWILVSRLILP